jgi:hypothetical protein
LAATRERETQSAVAYNNRRPTANISVEDDMDILLISMLPMLVPFVFLIVYGVGRAPQCPDCGSTLPVWVSPFKKTRRMWRAGGFLCARCGCETDFAGQKVTAATPPAPFPTLQWALLAVLLLIGAGLVTAALVRMHPEPPALAVAPPVVVPAN